MHFISWRALITIGLYMIGVCAYGADEIRLPWTDGSSWNCRIDCLPIEYAHSNGCDPRTDVQNADSLCDAAKGEHAYRMGSCIFDLEKQYDACPANGENECTSLQKRASWARSQGVPAKSFNWSAMKDKQVIFIGDIHTYTNPETVFKLYDF